MIIWGGGNADEALNDGGRYNPATDSWKPISSDCPLKPRVHHVAVWAGKGDRWDYSSGEMIIWGGSTRGGHRQSKYFRDGARYNPHSGTWTPLSKAGSPKGRILTRAFWTGAEMIFWGGVNDAQASGVGDAGRYVGTGGRYNPTTDTWSRMSAEGALTPRLTSAVWAGKGLLTFGGYSGTHLNDTCFYSLFSRP
jgi:N-acetylneuraminic acid mutarotase